MELTTQEVKDWIVLFSDFTWPVILVIALILYKDAGVHLIKVIIDVIFRRRNGK